MERVRPGSRNRKLPIIWKVGWHYLEYIKKIQDDSSRYVELDKGDIEAKFVFDDKLHTSLNTKAGNNPIIPE